MTYQSEMSEENDAIFESGIGSQSVQEMEISVHVVD
jgi:hypothetical protein